MNDQKAVIQWLSEDNNPAVKYRTLTEILNEPTDKEPVLAWLYNMLPEDWAERKGLWSAYYLTACAESGLSFVDIPEIKEIAKSYWSEKPFEHGCDDYMSLRALVRLGLADEPIVADIIEQLTEKQLPDGGFLCLHRLDKLKYTPKSCAKANMHALMFCAECKKKGVEVAIEKPLVDYFWKHNLFYRTGALETLLANIF